MEPESSLCFNSSRVRVSERNGGTEPEMRLWLRMTLESPGMVPIERGISPVS